MMILSAAICFIACHSGPADHFLAFAKELAQRNHDVQIYATGPALQKLKDVDGVISFSLEETAELAKNVQEAAAVITDVGDPFDLILQENLALYAPDVLRIAYYDNPEGYVPGGYSEIAARVMLAAQRVLFANANLAQMPVYRYPSQEIDLPYEKRIGLGYYPLDRSEKIAKRRSIEQDKLRLQFFPSLQDQEQKILIYAGGNNEEYFSKAFPSFLRYLGEMSQQMDLSPFIVVLQQHPGAKEKNLDANLVQQWLKENPGGPQILISPFSSDDAQVVADAILYFQTSMGPQFVLAGIPTIQVAHHTCEDLLVRNQLCSIATDADGLANALMNLKRETKSDGKIIRQELGICFDWADRLEEALSPPDHTNVP